MSGTSFPVADKLVDKPPIGSNELPGPSPEKQREEELKQSQRIANSLANTKDITPSWRQRTQSEVLNLALLYNEIGANPFSVRLVPFTVLREMMTDPTIAFARWFILNPLLTADRHVECEDAALAAAVDKAFRSIFYKLILQYSNAIFFGFAPGVKNWRVGPLDARYRDRHASDPDKEMKVWNSPNIGALLPDVPSALAPENCIPRWDDSGRMYGYTYSPVPIPNPMLLGIAETYGPNAVAGWEIHPDRAIWVVNEAEVTFGCQPPDELVLTKDGYKTIGELDEGTDRIASWDGSNSAGGHILRGVRKSPKSRQKAYPFEKGRRIYSGDLWSIRTDSGREINVTPNHKFTVKWHPDAKNYWAVYLMRRGDWWRIGTTQMGIARSNSGVGNRMQTEKANDAWILDVFHTKSEALAAEALWSHKYHVPDLTFEVSGARTERQDNANRLGNSQLHNIWNELDSRSGAHKLLAERGMSEDLPLFSRAIRQEEGKNVWSTQSPSLYKPGKNPHPKHRNRGFINRWTCYAANLIPGLMTLPVDPGEGQVARWEKFSIVKKPYSGFVYSLEVKPFHHYISNGIITQNSVYGNPRLKYVYKLWWSKWMRWAFYDRAFENTADPAKVVYYPTDVEEGFDVNDPNPSKPSPINIREKAIQAGRAARAGQVVAMPGTLKQGEDGKTLNMREWEIKYLEVTNNFPALAQGFQDIEIQMLRAMFLPEQAFLDSNVTGQGSSQRYVATQMGEIYRESEGLLLEEYDEYTNRYWVPQFVAANFPDKVNIPVAIRSGSLGVQDDELVKQVITVIGQKDPAALGIDVKELLRQRGIPLNSQAQQEASLEREAKVATAKGPPAMPPTPKKGGTLGYNAGIERTEAGEMVYVSPPGQLSLSSHTDFIKSLPNIPPYKHPTSRSAILSMRSLFLSHYRDELKSLAKDIREEGIVHMTAVNPKQEEEKQKMSAAAAAITAQAFVDGWLGKQVQGRANLVDSLSAGLSRIALSSASHELRRSSLDEEVINKKRIEQWSKEYAQECVQSVEDTIRSEVSTFLSDEIQHDIDAGSVADALEERFAETPQSHTERAVRTQVREAYNKGALFGAIDAGISQVQAHDASDGADRDTDIKCQKRNGKVMSPEDALKETEHPYGTLWWSYLSTENLSVQITDDIPAVIELSETAPGGYDARTETLYLRTRASADVGKWMIVLGEELKL